MSRRVVVVVPMADNTDVVVAGNGSASNRIVASLAITAPDGNLVVERAGSPVRVAQAAEDDALVVGFAAACARAGRSVPDGLRVRVSARALQEYSREVVLASTVAGVAASNTLLSLGLDDDELADIAAHAVGSDRRTTATVLGNCAIVTHHDCDDPLST